MIHIAFVVFCVLFFGATAVISFLEYMASGRIGLLFISVACVLCGAVLIPYSKHFLKKLKDIGYM